jgi:hypothetical protein
MTLKTIVATLLATGFVTAAAAQTSSGTDTTTGAGTTTTGTSTGAMSDTDFLAGIQSGTEDMSQWAVELAGLDPEAEVEIIPLSELEGMDMAGFDQSLQQGDQDLASARSAIEGHEALTEALEAEEFSAQDVLGVQVEGSESVKLYVDDRS